MSTIANHTALNPIGQIVLDRLGAAGIQCIIGKFGQPNYCLGVLVKDVDDVLKVVEAVGVNNDVGRVKTRYRIDRNGEKKLYSIAFIDTRAQAVYIPNAGANQ